MTAVAAPARTIVVGLGNPVLGDDGVGWQVLDALDRLLVPSEASVELDRLAVGGLSLMEHLVGFDRAILIDALVDVGVAPGSVSVRRLEELPGGSASHLDSSHDAALAEALAAGRALGARVPSEIVVVGIAARSVDRFGEGLSASVAAAVDVAAARVLGLLEEGRETAGSRRG